MTHVQKYWDAKDVIKDSPDISWEKVKLIKSWIKEKSSLPDYISDEQVVLFLHSCYNDIECTKKCIEVYYKLRLKIPQFFSVRDIKSTGLQKALKVLYYGILPEKTAEGYKLVFHMLNDTNPANYVYNDGFKLLTMMIDAVYAKEGPQNGLILVFDMKGVKLGHLTRIQLFSVRKTLEYIQEGIPVRLKAIHILNVNSVIDKIMLLIRPFIKKSLLNLINFHKENDEHLYSVLPKKCLPKNYGGDLESVEYYHGKFVEEMASLRPIFVEEENLMFKKETKSKKEELDKEIDLSSLNID